ncbi:O-methyltransferase [Micromonospora sp. WMMD737]|uniref:O-methyltransferase n=1 Tax=Micromonospora sp. WMMD737 TaxID=3404113 RepID=UPI003B9560EB
MLDDILRSSLLDHRMPTIQVDDNAGRVLQLLTMLRRPQRVVEVGTLFGYSTVFIARGLPQGARMTTIEIDPKAAELASTNLARAGLADRVEVVVGDAADHLSTIQPESVGMIFIDADKKSYPRYLKLCFPLLEPEGLLIADDAFAGGDFSPDHPGTEEDGQEAASIRAYAAAVGRSPRLFSCFVGTRHGLLISSKRT